MASMHRGDISKIKVYQLRAFVAVAKHKRFGEAALALGLSQSSVSHAIASLEEELGVALMVRGRQGAVLTPIGEQLLPDAQDILRLLEAIVGRAAQARGLSGGRVRLASLRSIATYVLPHLLATFQHQHPDIQVTLTQYFYNDDIQQALLNGSADIGFLELPISNAFETYELVVDEYVVLLPPVSSSLPTCLSWEQLGQFPIIMPASDYEGSLRLQNHLATHAPALKRIYEINEDSIQVAMAQQGLGAAILPHLAALPIPSEIPVYPLPLPLRRHLGAALCTEALHTPATFAFWDLLRSPL